MTEPTDAEIWQMWMPMARRMGVADPVDFARAVLAKWGTPAPASIEPDPLQPETKYNLGWAAGWDAHSRAHPHVQKTTENVHVAADVYKKAQESNMSAPAGVEPVAWQGRCRPTWGNNPPWTPWELCTKGQAEDYQKTPLLHDWEYEARALYTTPQPTQAQAGAVPLTDEQIAEGFAKRSRHIGLFAGGVRFAERHHGIKQGGKP